MCSLILKSIWNRELKCTLNLTEPIQGLSNGDLNACVFIKTKIVYGFSVSLPFGPLRIYFKNYISAKAAPREESPTVVIIIDDDDVLQPTPPSAPQQNI